MKMPAIRGLWPFRKGRVSPERPSKAGDATTLQGKKNIAALEAIVIAATPGARVQLDDIFVGPRIVPTEHEWYYGAKCRWCHRTSVVLRDPDEGQKRLSFSGSGAIRSHCHHCNGLLMITPAQIVWFQFEG